MKIFKKIGNGIKNTFGTLIIFIAGIFREVLGIPELQNGLLKAVEDLKAQIAQQNNNTNMLLTRLIQKPNMPMLINLAGHALNLAVEKKLKIEVMYNQGKETLLCRLYDDYKLFDEYMCDLTKFGEEGEKKAIFDLGRVLLRKKEPGLIEKIQTMVMTELIIGAQYKERLNHSELFNILIFGYLDAVKPYWIKANENRVLDNVDTKKRTEGLKLVELDKEETEKEAAEIKQKETVIMD